LSSAPRDHFIRTLELCISKKYFFTHLLFCIFRLANTFAAIAASAILRSFATSDRGARFLAQASNHMRF
jgi:hypothetical protein